jgi:hypothetical protein
MAAGSSSVTSSAIAAVAGARRRARDRRHPRAAPPDSASMCSIADTSGPLRSWVRHVSRAASRIRRTNASAAHGHRTAGRQTHRQPDQHHAQRLAVTTPACPPTR